MSKELSTTLPKYLTVERAAFEIGISPRSMEKIIHAGCISIHDMLRGPMGLRGRPGKRLLKTSEVLEYAENCRIKTVKTNE